VEALELLAEARQLNPTPWADHALNVARVAEAIAAHVSEADREAGAAVASLDPETAFVLGVLHDIGRREGVTRMRHTIDGYRHLMGLGFDDAARICLTHSFPMEDVKHVKTSAAGPTEWDCTDEEREFVNDYLADIEYDDYDRLIQLCDTLALPERVCSLEERFVDVVLRHGFTEYTVPRWRAFIALRERFESMMGCSLASVLDELAAPKDARQATT
jgi:hypothetical protein